MTGTMYQFQFAVKKIPLAIAKRCGIVAHMDEPLKRKSADVKKVKLDGWECGECHGTFQTRDGKRPTRCPIKTCRITFKAK